MRFNTVVTMVLAACVPGLPGAYGASIVKVAVSPAGPVRVTTPAAEFELRASGYLRGRLLKNGQQLTLDDPLAGPAGGGDLLLSGGAPVRFKEPDFRNARVTDIRQGIGTRGKRIEVTSKQEGAGLEKVLALEVCDDFPQIALLAITYRNTGKTAVKLDQVSVQRHRLSATLTDRQAAPYDMWSFQGSSYKWGADDVTPLKKGFSQPNLVGVATSSGMGGGIPVVAFWTRAAGMAIGHAEPRASVVSLPVEVGDDGRVAASIRIDVGAGLKPGEAYTTPRTFLAVFSGDYYEPLSMWSAVLQRQAWIPAQPPDDAFEANWCGWGYLGTVTPEQMVGTIPKLKEFGIKWATLDAGWYDVSGDWNANPKTFPADAVKRMVDEFHKNGIRIAVWWAPLEAADGQGSRRGRAGTPSSVAKEHPEWVIQDAKGKRAGLRNNSLTALCPAHPEVQAYFRQVTEKLIRDLDFDGQKMDYIFSVPRCYNPAHHHKSPDESVQAVADVYRIIYETAGAIKPYSVTQICPCGTTPNMAWLPYQNQAVTADPVGSVQVRRRIKLYKAMLGPRSAVYGDHVELSKIRFEPNKEVDIGEDFASTIGAGGVLGTKFTWPDYGNRFEDVFLTPRKQAIWKRWIGIYNSMMLSRGTFRNLYTIGYDTPEGYAIAKDHKMYYGFFVGEAQEWEGTLELRGLARGKYHVYDYLNGKELGTVDGPNATLRTKFTEHLLLEVSELKD